MSIPDVCYIENVGSDVVTFNIASFFPLLPSAILLLLAATTPLMQILTDYDISGSTLYCYIMFIHFEFRQRIGFAKQADKIHVLKTNQFKCLTRYQNGNQ